MRFTIMAAAICLCLVSAVKADNATVEDQPSNFQGNSGTSSAVLSEIIVTAQKKSERLQDVPVPVTVLNASTLAENNENRLQDYFTQVPGLNLSANSFGAGTQYITIRGISTSDYSNPTVGLVIDDVPYGSSSQKGLGELLYPDLDPSDLAQIEVLKGPQGTLYGASSLGGLIKVVTQDPSTDSLSGKVQLLGDNVDHGASGYGGRGAVNIPLTDTLAIRASGFARRDPGYIDNVTTGQENINSADVYGGRLSALWRPSEFFSAKVTAILQNTTADGAAEINANSFLQPTVGNYDQTGVRGVGAYSADIRLYIATLNAKLGNLDFVSITGYGNNKWHAAFDYSQYFGAFTPAYGVAGTLGYNDYQTRKISQEFRLSSTGGHYVDWLLAAFYTHESTPTYQNYTANDVQTGVPVHELIDFDSTPPSTVSERAIFGDITVHITDRFDVQFGGRESWNQQTYSETNIGPLVPVFDNVPSPYVQGTERASGDAFTYLIVPSFRISRDLMAYARIASGYRIGGVNYDVSAAPGIPGAYSPDKTTNYELGFKADLFDHALTIDTSVYYVDWRNIQLTEYIAPDTFGTNGGNAKSEGVEFSGQWRASASLKISTALSLGEAELTQNFPVASAAFGLKGDRLPYSTHFSGSITLDQDIGQVGSVTGFVGGTVAYVGLREGEFSSTPAQARLIFPAYTTLGLHAGARWDSWLVNIFANNVTDRRGILGGNQLFSFGSSGYYESIIQPRTIGLTASKSF